MDLHPLAETWAINARINLFLLDSLSEAQLDAKPTKGRVPRAQMVHILNVRLMWLQSARPDLHGEQTKLENTAATEELRLRLQESAKAIETLVQDAVNGDLKVKGHKPHVYSFVSYLISHESHHRGQLELALRIVGDPISDKVSYGLWEWGVR